MVRLSNTPAYLVDGKDVIEVKESDLIKAFQKHKIDINNEEIKEMFYYMNDNNENINKDKKDLTVPTNKFKDFYINC